METRANYVAIGLFTLVFLIICFLSVLWMTTLQNGTKQVPVKILFPGPVTGLYPGGNVLFNGIKVGAVQNLSFDPDDPKRIIALVGLSPDVPLRKDTVASLGFTGLTGVAHIELSGGTARASSLFETDKIPVIMAQRSTFDTIVDGAKQIIQKTDEVLTHVDVLLKSGGDVDTLLKEAGTFTNALARNADNIDIFLTSTAETSRSLTVAARGMMKILTQTEAILETIDPPALRKAAENLFAFIETLNAMSPEMRQVLRDTDRVVIQFQDILTHIDSQIQGNGEGFLVEATRAATSIRKIADTFEKSSTPIADGLRNFSTHGLNSVQDLITQAKMTLRTLNRRLEEFGENPQSVIFGKPPEPVYGE